MQQEDDQHKGPNSQEQVIPFNLIKVDRVLVTLQTVCRSQKIVFLVQVTGNSLQFIHVLLSSYSFSSFSIPYLDPLNY